MKSGTAQHWIIPLPLVWSFLKPTFLERDDIFGIFDLGPHTDADIIKLLKLFLFDGPLVFQASLRHLWDDCVTIVWRFLPPLCSLDFFNV